MIEPCFFENWIAAGRPKPKPGTGQSALQPGEKR
jgi:hypothetical protein